MYLYISALTNRSSDLELEDLGLSSHLVFDTRELTFIRLAKVTEIRARHVLYNGCSD